MRLNRAVISGRIIPLLVAVMLIVGAAGTAAVELLSPNSFDSVGDAAWWAATDGDHGRVRRRRSRNERRSVHRRLRHVRRAWPPSSMITAVVTSSFVGYQQRRLGQRRRPASGAHRDARADRAAARRDRAAARLAVDADQDAAGDDERGARDEPRRRPARTCAARATRASRPTATRSRRSARRRTRGRARTPRTGRRTTGRSRARRARTRRRLARVSGARLQATNASDTAVPVSIATNAATPGSASRRVGPEPADERVPRRERDGADERVDEPDALEVLGPRAIAREEDAAGDDERGAEDAARRRAARRGRRAPSRPRRAAPSRPSPTCATRPRRARANVKRICAIPGASRPARTNGHALARSQSPASDGHDPGDRARRDDREERSRPPAARRVTSAMRTRTVIAPKRNAESAARTIARHAACRSATGEPTERRRRRGLRHEDPGHHHRAAEPAGPARAPRSRAGRRRARRTAPRA